MKLLLVEDSPTLRRTVSTGLRSLGFQIEVAADGREALDHLADSSYDVVILDLMLPRVPGLEVLREMRRNREEARVLILSAMDQTEDRVRGLDLGADDYLVKPFAFDELVSRIRALFRRNSGSRQVEMEIREVLIDTISRRVRFQGKDVVLTPQEYNLLEFLVRRKGQVFSQDQLIDRLFTDSSFVTRNAVEAHVSALRRKLKAVGAPRLVETRRGFGYLVES